MLVFGWLPFYLVYLGPANRDLLLEHEKWSSERDKHSKEYQQALAIRDRAKVFV